MERVALVRAWHAALAVLIAVALVWQLSINIGEDRSVVNFFSYFTIQSNLLMMVASGLLVARPTRDETWFGVVRMAGLVGITVTGIVYATILAGSLPLTGAEKIIDTIVHYIVPAASLLGFVLLRPRTAFRPTAWWALAWPVVWLAYSLVRAEVSSPEFPMSATTTSGVPYDFLDVDAHGVGGVTIACLGVTALVVLLTYAYGRIGRVSRPTP